MKTWISMGTLAIVCAACAGGTWAQGASASAAVASVPIYSKNNAPATPKLEDLPLRDSVSQYGITWTFEMPARAGQFTNGDWYVVGPVNVVKMDPAPRYGKEVADDELDGREKVPVDRRCRNGSMLNAPARQEVAWDSGVLNYYHPEHRARLPIAMKPGDSLASSISLRQGEKVTYPYHPGTVRGVDDNSPVKTVAVLTCVADPLPPDAFRPGYCGHDPKIYLARDLKRDLLPRFDQPADAPDPTKFAELFQRPWCDAGFFSFDVPQQSMPNYAQCYAQGLADAVLLACCEGTKPEDKERLLINVIQIGIDHYGLIRHGHPGWPAHGGHGSGRKFPIVFAGAMLGDETMAHINQSFPKAAFGEDEQTAYGDCWTGAKVVFTGHSGIDEVTGIGRDFVRAGNPWGPYEHLTPDKWVPEEFRSDAYRRANTSTCFVAQALVLRTMKLEKTWNHDAFFDYVDRWMFEDDKPFRIEIAKYCRPPYSKDVYLDDSKDWFHEGYADQPWVKQLWSQYRPLCPAPTDGWKQKHDDSYYLSAIEKQRKK
ncbi:MAG: hypothetical protein ABSH34_20410 [Verrucomicrobiota bacterium]|jgi:hypothetical protein